MSSLKNTDVINVDVMSEKHWYQKCRCLVWKNTTSHISSKV